MNVKGTALTTTRDFVKSKFPGKYQDWVNSLPENTKKIYSSTIDATKWYPLDDGYKIPVKKVIEIFYSGDQMKGGEDIGRYSAEIALKGFYKVFLLVASPGYLLNRASRMFSTFYEPSEINVTMEKTGLAIFRIIRFEGIDSALEYRIAGWIKKALELANCTNPNYKVLKSLAKGEEATEIEFSWS